MDDHRLQALAIKALQTKGFFALQLPDGMRLEVGVTQDDPERGEVRAENYCSITAYQHGRSVAIDSYNIGLSFRYSASRDVVETEGYDPDGARRTYVEVV